MACFQDRALVSLGLILGCFGSVWHSLLVTLPCFESFWLLLLVLAQFCLILHSFGLYSVLLAGLF